jgi:serine/threonine protein kinase
MAAFDHIIGSVLDGKYEVQRLVARGGMGEVYAGAHLQLERPVAIKVLHGDLSDKEAFVNRFAREARTAARLEHPNAVHIYDFGALEDGSTYLVMEFIEGVTLREVIRRNGKLALGTALDLMRQAASAVGAAHARGIVHRDLKPENMMVRRDDTGRVILKVVDFGLAKMVENQTSQVTNKSELIGTPKYMAPEQFSGDRIDERVDVYALGCVFFEMLAGRAPYEGTMMEIVGKHVHAEAPRFALLGIEVPEPVEAAVRHALEKDPANRTASAADLVREIEAACGGDLPVEAEPIVIPPPPPSGVTVGHTPSELPTRRGPTTPALGEKPVETRYAGDAVDEATRLRDAQRPTVVVPGESGEVSAAVTKPMDEIRRTVAELPSRPARRSRALRIAAGAAAILALTATGFWAFNEMDEPAPAVDANSIEVSPVPPAVPPPPTPAAPEPVAEPPAEPAEPAKEEPKPAARASKAKTERKTESRVEVNIDPEADMGEMNFDDEEWKKLATPPPGLTPQQRRDYIRAMRELQKRRLTREAIKRRKQAIQQVDPVHPTPPAPKAP